MAHTVPLTKKLNPYEERMIEFKGLNRKPVVDEGEMSDMKNLTSDNYPLLCPRKLRGTYDLPDGAVNPLHIITKYEKIAMIAEKEDGSVAFWYGDDEVEDVDDLTKDSYMIPINNKICFYPQKSVLTLTDYLTDIKYDYAYMDAVFDISEDKPVQIHIYTNDVAIIGSSMHYFEGLKSDDAIDMKGTINYTKTITPDDEGDDEGGDDDGGDDGGDDGDDPYNPPDDEEIGTGLEEGGGTDAANAVIPVESVPTYITYHSINVEVSFIIGDINGSSFTAPLETFIELLGEDAEDVDPISLTFFGTISRTSPDIDIAMEWNNRLWGACNEDNTIYACKLGDPTNWRYYQGTGFDSYYAQQGTDGEWTGIGLYSNHLLFFKQNSVSKVYGSAPSNYQTVNMQCFGVEAGSGKSVCVINDTVMYKSKIGIMAYDGEIPYCISEKFNMTFKNVISGTDGRKYYASVQKDDDSYELLVLDPEKAVWHKEDEIRFRDTCTLNGSMYFICDEDYNTFESGKVYIVNPDTATEERKDCDWMAVFGPFDEYIEECKVFSRPALRLVAQPRSMVTVYIKIDNGGWEMVKRIAFAETKGEIIPIIPRRCDKYSIMIKGKGDCEIKSLTRRYRKG